MSYLKIVDNKIATAPYIIEKDGKTIYGYNRETNEEMLFKDGYAKYEKGPSAYMISNGKIVPKPAPTPSYDNTIFTKLQIRRALRKLNLEKVLDTLLSSNVSYKNEWNDAVEIDLDDPMIQEAVDNHIITQEMLDALKRELK